MVPNTLTIATAAQYSHGRYAVRGELGEKQGHQHEAAARDGEHGVGVAGEPVGRRLAHARGEDLEHPERQGGGRHLHRHRPTGVQARGCGSGQDLLRIVRESGFERDVGRSRIGVAQLSEILPGDSAFLARAPASPLFGLFSVVRGAGGHDGQEERESGGRLRAQQEPAPLGLGEAAGQRQADSVAGGVG